MATYAQDWALECKGKSIRPYYFLPISPGSRLCSLGYPFSRRVGLYDIERKFSEHVVGYLEPEPTPKQAKVRNVFYEEPILGSNRFATEFASFVASCSEGQNFISGRSPM